MQASKDRARLRAELDKRAAQREARALSLALRAERKADRAETKRDRTEDRRNAIRAANYPLDASEVVSLCEAATVSAGVAIEARADVSQGLALEIIRRHGVTPDRAAIGVEWLKVRAHAHFVGSLRATERATGQTAASRELPAGDDPVYLVASDSGNVAEVAPISVDRIVASLPNLTDRQRDTVCTWLGDRAEPLTNLERQHFHAAMGKLRTQSPAAIRRAFRDEMRSARETVDRAIAAEMIRANVASRGC